MVTERLVNREGVTLGRTRRHGAALLPEADELSTLGGTQAAGGGRPRGGRVSAGWNRLGGGGAEDVGKPRDVANEGKRPEPATRARGQGRPRLIGAVGSERSWR